MSIRRFSFNDDLAVFDNFFGFAQPTFSLLRGEFYNPEQFDLVPKKSFTEQQLKFKRKCLEELKERRKGDMIAYDEQEKDLILEIGQLEKRIDQK